MLKGGGAFTDGILNRYDREHGILERRKDKL